MGDFDKPTYDYVPTDYISHALPSEKLADDMRYNCRFDRINTLEVTRPMYASPGGNFEKTKGAGAAWRSDYQKGRGALLFFRYLTLRGEAYKTPRVYYLLRGFRTRLLRREAMILCAPMET